MRPSILEAVHLDVPSDWQDETILTLLGPAGGGAQGRPSVVVARDALEADLAAYAREQLARLREETTAFTSLREEAPSPDRFVAEHTFSTDEGAPVRQIQVFLARGGEVVVLSATAPASQFERVRADLERIVDSFRLR